MLQQPKPTPELPLDRPTLTTTSRIFNIGSNSVFQYNNGKMKSDVVCKLPNISFHDTKIREIFLSFMNAQIPNSFYLVNRINNTLIINATTYIIPPGNYNAVNFLSTIQSGILTSLGITGTYNSIQNKYTFTSATSFTIQPTSTCSRFLGLDSNISYSGTSITSLYPANFLPISRLLVKSTAFNTNNFNSADNSSDMILSVQNSSASGALILYNNYTNTKYDVSSLDNLNLIDITITDDFGNLLDFENADWYLTFKIEYIYESKINDLTFERIIKQRQLGGSSRN